MAGGCVEIVSGTAGLLSVNAYCRIESNRIESNRIESNRIKSNQLRLRLASLAFEPLEAVA
jgi:ribosomal protein L16/L10AE